MKIAPTHTKKKISKNTKTTAFKDGCKVGNGKECTCKPKDGVKVWTECGDSLEAMKKLPDKSVDLIITDPPYQMECSGAGLACKRKVYNGELDKITDGISNEYLEEMYRVMKTPNIYLWCNKEQVPQYLDFFHKEKGCNFDILTWHKTNPTPLCGNTYLPDTEYCLFFRKNAKLLGRYATKHRYWLTTTNKVDKDKYDHPTVKPQHIIENLIENSSKPGDVVLDPFMGSGTTGAAAVKMGRSFAGYEWDPKFYKTAVDRICSTKCELTADADMKPAPKAIKGGKKKHEAKTAS